MRVFAFAFAFTLALSGCLNAAKQPVDPASAIDAESGLPAWVKDAIAGGESHDHNDPAQHANTTTPNFHVLGYDPMITQRYGATGSAGCGGAGITTEGRKLAASPAPGVVWTSFLQSLGISMWTLLMTFFSQACRSA